jgi:hypothetical protein
LNTLLLLLVVVVVITAVVAVLVAFGQRLDLLYLLESR